MLKQRSEYSRYYGGFRGVDFGTDHTLVADNRFPYAVNMYKDYVSGSGQGIETIPGFRRRFEAPNGGRIHGIHTVKIDGVDKVLIHAGNTLYEWTSYSATEDDDVDSAVRTKLFETMNDHDSVSIVINNRLYLLDGKNYLYYDGNDVHHVADNAYIPTTYINIIPAGENADIGQEYEQRNMLSPCFKHTFIADGENKVFVMNEPNLDAIVSVKVYGTELATTAYTVNHEKGEIILSEAPGKPEDNGFPELYAGVEITAKRPVYEAKSVIVKKNGEETTLAELKGYNTDDFVSMIETATIATIFDNRIFFSGIEGRPNLLLYCSRNNTGQIDPSYIGVLNYMEDGIGTTPITAMLGVANSLLVLKADTQQDGSVYYHTPYDTGSDIIPRIYPSEAGLAGTGCLGAAINFLDDPVFISRLGLDAIGQLSVRYERAREHRSSMVDAKLCNGRDLAKAKLAEWGGYLFVLCEDRKLYEDGKEEENSIMFLADSRQLYQAPSGNMEYEWYYLDGIGVYQGQYTKYFFLDKYPFLDSDGNEIPITVEYEGETLAVQLLPDELKPSKEDSDEDSDEEDAGIRFEESLKIVNGMLGETKYSAAIFEIEGKRRAFFCNTLGEQIGGEFDPAVCIKTLQIPKGENLFFGTKKGVVCCFNFDKKDAEGLIRKEDYTFDGRAIYSGCATKLDNCGSPNMTKTTAKRSTVVKMKNFWSSGAKIRVRTNQNPFTDIARINSQRFTFDGADFAELSFDTKEDTLFSIKEKVKKWAEKQYYFFSDEYLKPFSMFYVAFKYYVVGKFKG